MSVRFLEATKIAWRLVVSREVPLKELRRWQLGSRPPLLAREIPCKFYIYIYIYSQNRVTRNR